MILSFVLIGIVGLVLIAVLNQLKWAWWWRALAALGVTAAVVIAIHSLLVHLLYTAPTLGPSTDGQTWFNASPFRELILFASLLFGMVARVLSLAIERRDSEAAAKMTSPSLRLDKWQFVYPMLFAIPTFGGLLSQMQTTELSTTSAVLAFQTGFFWQTILKRAEPK